MRKKSILCLILSFLVILSNIPVVAITQLTENPVIPAGYTTAISWDTYYSNSLKTGNVTKTNNSLGSGLDDYGKYINLNITAGNTYKNDQSYYTNSSGFGIENGDAILIHLIARSTPATEPSCGIRMSLWRNVSGSSNTSDSTAGGKAAFIVYYTELSSDWTEYYFPVSVDCGTYSPTKFAMFFGSSETIAQSLDIACLEVLNYGSVDVNDLPQGAYNLENKTPPVIEDDTVDFFEEFAGNTQAVTGIDGILTAKILKGTYNCSFESVADTLSQGDYLLFSFVFKSIEKSTPVTITVNAGSAVGETYYIPVQWSRVYMPVKITALSSVTIKCDDAILLGEAKFVNYHSQTYDSSNGFFDQLSGQHLLEDFECIAIDKDENCISGTSKTTDLIQMGKYIYTIGNGALYVVDSSAQTPTVIGALAGLGADIRQIAAIDDAHVIITSRQDGAFIIDVSNPSSPAICSRYDSMEMATGLTVYDGYAYICNRQNGVEIINIKDINNPYQCAIVRDPNSATVQSCTVYDGILYCGLWNEMRVDLYNVTNPDSPALINQINIHGKGDGVTVAAQGDKVYLYAATAQHGLTSTNDTSDNRSNLDFGQGNGLDIFDVTDVYNVSWLSTTRIDGRYYYANNDYWGVSVADGDDGHRYAYYYDTYVGVYVLDVTNPSAPLRISHISIQSKQASGDFKKEDYSTRDEIFPYDQDDHLQSPIGSVLCKDGIMYIASKYTALHYYEADYTYSDIQNTVQTRISDDTGAYYDFDGSSLPGFQSYSTVGQAYRAAYYNGLVYVVAGYQGLLIFNEDDISTPLKTIDISGCAMDIKIQNSCVYIAQKEGGLGCYTLSQDGLSLTNEWQYTTTSGVIRDVDVSSTGKFILIQAGSSYYEIINYNTKSRVVKTGATSQCYHRCILNGSIDNRYYAFYTCANGRVILYDFGENDSYDEPVLVKTLTSSKTSMQGSATVYENHILTTYYGGYYLYDILSDTYTNGSSLSSLSGRKYDSSKSFYGMPVICQSKNILILSDRIYGKIYIVDISDINNPAVVKTLSVNGNPDIALITDNSIIIPMGYQGVFRFDLSAFDFSREEAHVHCVCGGTCTNKHTCDTQTEYKAWRSTTSLPTVSGNYYLKYDITVSTQTNIAQNADVNLCLNGHTITQTAEKRVIGMSTTDASLSICDCSAAESGTITSAAPYSDHGAIIQLANNTAVLNIYGGNITAFYGESSNNRGGAISADKGTFNFYGGNIKGGTATFGGAITVGGTTSAVFNMYGGSIIGSKVTAVSASFGGGAVFVKDTGILNVFDGIIQGGNALYGDTIYSSGTINFTGGTVLNGSVYVSSGVFNISGSSYISDNCLIYNASGNPAAINIATLTGKIVLANSSYGQTAAVDTEYSDDNIAAAEGFVKSYKDGYVILNTVAAVQEAERVAAQLAELDTEGIKDYAAILGITISAEAEELLNASLEGKTFAEIVTNAETFKKMLDIEIRKASQSDDGKDRVVFFSSVNNLTDYDAVAICFNNGTQTKTFSKVNVYKTISDGETKFDVAPEDFSTISNWIYAVVMSVPSSEFYGKQYTIWSEVTLAGTETVVKGQEYTIQLDAESGAIFVTAE